MDLTALPAATLAVLAKRASEAAKDTRGELSPGKHRVDETIVVRVAGDVTVGKDYTSHIVAKADPWALLACALGRLNEVTVEVIVKEATTKTSADVKALKKQVTDAVAAVKAPTATACRGAVRVDKSAVVLATAIDLNLDEPTESAKAAK